MSILKIFSCFKNFKNFKQFKVFLPKNVGQIMKTKKFFSLSLPTIPSVLLDESQYEQHKGKTTHH
jgi:hypothetical protein